MGEGQLQVSLDKFATLEVVRAEEAGLAHTETTWKKECDVTTKFGGK